MNARTLRRAAERKTQKLAAKSEIFGSQLAANRSNAQLSTGPSTGQGKRISSLNAVKTGLTGQTVLLPSDDAPLYERYVQRFIADTNRKPIASPNWSRNMADAQWRLNRIPGLEMALFARGRIQFAELFAAYDESIAAALTDAETMVVYHRELRNLTTQEARIHRQYQKDLTELKLLQEQRAAIAKPADRPPSSLPLSSPASDQNGFEFATTLEAREKLPQAA
jgi:hypothetical protein